MPPKAAKPALPTRASGRRSGAVTQFLSLDLYSKGSFESAVKCFDPNENHNGVKVDTPAPSVVSAAAAPAAKRRGQSANSGASHKRQKRSSSTAPPDGGAAPSSSLTSVKVTAPAPAAAATPATPKKRGRPPGPPKTATKTPRTPAKQTPKTPVKQPRKTAAAKTPKKTPAKQAKQPRAAPAPIVVKQEPPESDYEVEGVDGEQDEPAQPQVFRRAGRQAGAPSPARVSAPPSLAALRANARATLDALIASAEIKLTDGEKEELGDLLRGLVERATTPMSAADYAKVVANLQQAFDNIVDKQAPADVETLKGKMAALEKSEVDHAIERVEWKRSEKALKKSVADGASKVNELVAKSRDLEEKTRRDRAAHKLEMDRVLGQLATLESLGRAREASPPRVPRPPTAPFNQLMIPQQAGQFNLAALPKGTAIGHTQMAGRADELISGIGSVAGIGDSLASVAVTAATMPEYDEQGHLVQRTVRTRIERIAVTDDMDVDELRRLGFQVVSVEGSDEEEDEDGVANNPPACIEEVEDDNDDEEEEDDDDDGPLIEEAE